MAQSTIQILAVAIVLATISNSVTGYVQTLTVYFDPAEQGTHFQFRDSIPDVPLNILDSADHYCVQGLWVGFTSSNYEGEFTEVRGDGAGVQCYPKPFPYRSFRYGGHLETTKVGLSVYSDPGYQGLKVEEVTTPAQAALSGQSIIFSGASDWQLYEGQNFQNELPNVCVKVGADNEALGLQGYVDVTSLGLKMVGSVIQTKCPGKNIF